MVERATHFHLTLLLLTTTARVLRLGLVRTARRDNATQTRVDMGAHAPMSMLLLIRVPVSTHTVE